MVNVVVTQSQQINAPGTYAVTTPGVTLTLPVWGGWWSGGSWKVKDMTGAANPGITIVAAGGGTIDGQPSATINAPYESLTLDPFMSGNTWTLA